MLVGAPRVGSYPWSVTGADVNGDGRVDVISADSFSGTATVLLNSPDPPLLNIQSTTTNTIVLSWSVAWPGFGPQKNSVLGTTNWVGVGYSTNVVNGVDHATLPSPGSNTFFRLKHP